MSRGLLFILLMLAPAGTQAKVLEIIPSSYVKVSYEFPGGGTPPGQLSKMLTYVDGPVLRWRGSWKHPDLIDEVPDPSSPVPELLAPVRVVIPGIYKFYDLEARDSTHGEIAPETFTPDSRIYRVLLPITAMKRSHRFEILFHAGLRVPMNIIVEFNPPQGIVIRNGECVRQGVSLDLAVLGHPQPPAKKEKGKEKEKPVDPDSVDPTLIYLFCSTESDEIQTGIYAPLDRTWQKYGFNAKKIYNDRGLFFGIPRPERGVVVPETVTEFELERASGKRVMYELRYNPPYRPRLFSAHFMLAPSYHHYGEDRRNMDVDEWAIYGKLSLTGKLLPEGLDAGFDIDGTIQDIWHTPSDRLPAMDYWSMNVRLGYVERVVPDNPEWSFMTGWWWWRFYVVQEAYGLTDKLGGPLLFLQRRFQPVHGPTWWLNGRWVFAGPQEWPRDLQNYEVMLGGGVEILWVDKRRPLSLTGELSRVHFSSHDSTMIIQNVIVGLSYQLY